MESNINAQKEQIKNGIEAKKEQVQKRREKGAAHAAVNTALGNDDK